MPNGQPRRQLDATRARELFGFEAQTRCATDSRRRSRGTGKSARPRLTLAALAAVEVGVVAAIGVAYGTDGPLSTVAALVLAPVAVALTWRLPTDSRGVALRTSPPSSTSLCPLWQR